MTDKDIQLLMDVAKRAMQEVKTPEQALRSLQLAGILDKDGNYTPPYKDLEKLTGQ
jgi:hypothetical protein